MALRERAKDCSRSCSLVLLHQLLFGSPPMTAANQRLLAPLLLLLNLADG